MPSDFRTECVVDKTQCVEGFELQGSICVRSDVATTLSPSPSPTPTDPRGLFGSTTTTPTPTPTPTPSPSPGIAFGPEMEAACEQAVQQSSAASSLVRNLALAEQCVPALQFGETGNLQNAQPSPIYKSGLDIYASCIVFPFSMDCQNGIPVDKNIPPLTPPDPATCNLDRNYPGCPGADIFKFNQESIACESAANSAAFLTDQVVGLTRMYIFILDYFSI